MSDAELRDPIMSPEAILKATQKHNSTNILTNEFATMKLHNYVAETWDQSGKLISPILVLPLSRRQSEMPVDQLPSNEAIFTPAQIRGVYNKPPNTATTNTFMWTSISKMYSDVDDKYSGHPNESFDSKFKTFETYCTRAGIPNEKKNEVFDMILKGSALEYYRTICNNSSSIPDIEFLKKSIIDAFQEKERKLATIAQWNELTLQKIVDKRDDKDVKAALNSLIITLRKMQPILHEDLQTETFLFSKLLVKELMP
ncbi:putative glycosyl, partial [Erysiphe neolycopersici]